MGLKPAKAYEDFWYKKMGDHYEYIAGYVDDIICFSKNPLRVIDKFKKTYVMKAIETPKYYLG